MAFILPADTHQMEKNRNEAPSTMCSDFEKKAILRQLHKTKVQNRVKSAIG